MCFGSLLCFLVFLAKVPQMKKYYIVLSIVNKSPSDVTLSYLKNGQIMEQDIKGNATIRISVTITSSKQPDDVGFKVFQKGTNSPMVINGSDSLIVRPMENATTNLVVVNDGTLNFYWQLTVALVPSSILQALLLFFAKHLFINDLH